MGGSVSSTLGAVSCCTGGNSAYGARTSSRQATKDYNSERQALLGGDRTDEHQAVAALSRLFETSSRVNVYEGDALRALTTLAKSDVHQLQLSAATAFSEVSAYDVRAVSGEAISTVLGLLQSSHADVQQGAGAALGNLASNVENKRMIVEKGGLQHLVRQMMSPNTDAQADAAGCITNLATDIELKNAVALSGALIPLVRLAGNGDLRVQRNAAGALLNMTHTTEHRRLLVDAGAVAVLVSLLETTDSNTRYYAVTALSNVAADESGRQVLWSTEPTLVDLLIEMTDRVPVRTQAQATLALRNLASDPRFQTYIVIRGAAPALLPMLRSPHPALVSAAAACLRNLSIDAANEKPIIAAGLLPPLTALISGNDRDVQCHALATLRNLAANGGEDKQALLDAGLFDHLRTALSAPQCAPQVSCEIAAALSVFAASMELWLPIVEQGLCRNLVRLLRSPDKDTEYNACLALRALATKRMPEVFEELMHLWVVRAEPRAGLRAYVLRVLTMPEYARSPIRAIALWLVMALLGCVRVDLRKRIVADCQLMAAVEDIARARVACCSSVSTASDTCSVASSAFSRAELVAVGKGRLADGHNHGFMAASPCSEPTVASDLGSPSEADCGEEATFHTWSLACQVVALLHREPAAAAF
ncbi:Vacuolar protein 8 [Coemansia asiatica]|uniref:Vacuolar protein 8 n=1 Tax=Coemansia asiatica TaxID=1052880 RepID=A0A9W8CKN8_9FUNG|nr:Vacuolar protein 8 [Coemansia asiatica]